ncbi:hypothetical protein L1267_21790 [Pseudoalteromonas sp. OFAV1]|uniref:hypothetical protein n=1 Tax=Pseudoalteromonas sp. OFAV1 TaxID=2908892 RepID=UPI001F47CC1F|nr:hypothetical protein [Pseudoalteromonas sp. OFAV1]MCF2903009.1 hypothetical protein [Pseudoalteromonas sp. OFAV1]
MTNTKQKLALVHNLTESKLKFSLSLGGIPNPSMAVFNTEFQFENYGEISLIKDISKHDFKSMKAFDADIYSSRAPACCFEVKKEVIESFSAELDVLLQEPEFGKTKRQIINYISPVRGRGSDGFDELCNNFLLNTPLITLAFLRDNGRDYQLPKNAPEHLLSKFEPLLSELADVKLSSERFNESDLRLLSTITYRHLPQFLEEKAQTPTAKITIRNRFKGDIDAYKANITNRLFDDVNGEPKLNIYHYNSIKQIAEQEQGSLTHKINVKVLNSELGQIAAKNRKAIEIWLETKLGDAFINPHFFHWDKNEKRKRESYTLENLQKYMNRQLHNADLNGSTTSASIRSILSKPMSSLNSIQLKAHKLGSEKEYDDTKEHLDRRLLSLLDVIDNGISPEIKNFDRFKIAMESVLEYAKTQNASSFTEHHKSLSSFKPNEAFISEINSLLKDIQSAPVHYFEVKSSAPLEVNNFDEAIIPNDLPEQIVEQLRESGLKITVYNPENEFERSSKIAKSEFVTSTLDKQAENNLSI